KRCKRGKGASSHPQWGRETYGAFRASGAVLGVRNPHLGGSATTFATFAPDAAGFGQHAQGAANFLGALMAAEVVPHLVAGHAALASGPQSDQQFVGRGVAQLAAKDVAG